MRYFVTDPTSGPTHMLNMDRANFEVIRTPMTVGAPHGVGCRCVAVGADGASGRDNLLNCRIWVLVAVVAVFAMLVMQVAQVAAGTVTGWDLVQ